MNDLQHVFQKLRTESPILYVIVWIHLLGAVACIVGLFIDERSLMGVNVWIKPLKFCISGAIFIATIGFLVTLYPFSKRKKNILNNLTSWTLLIEIGIIVYQASRNVPSHYNQATLLDRFLFAAMGILVGVNVLIMLVFLVETLRLKLHTSKDMQLALLIGWVILIAGSWVGGQMIAQMSHNIGVADGGPGLALLNWSTEGGDLRVAHFFGLHGIQIIPLAALYLSRKWKTSRRNHLLSVALIGGVYAAGIAYLYVQACQGIPLVA